MLLHRLPYPFLILSLALMAIAAQSYAEAGIGRLFTTPEQRARLDQLRARPDPESITAVIPRDEPETAQPDADGIIVRGIVHRDKGKSTAWVNGSNTYEGSFITEYLDIEQDDINTTTITIKSREKGNIILKPGQIYDLDTQQIIDPAGAN